MHRLFGKAKPKVEGPSLGERLSYTVIFLVDRLSYVISLVNYSKDAFCT